MKKTLLFLLVVSLMCSCVPRKDLIYLQGQPITEKEIREINDIPYKLQVHDILNIEIKGRPTQCSYVISKSGKQQCWRQ